MKIIFAIPDMGSGGAERVISILCSEMSRQNIDTEILMLFGNRIHYSLPPSTRVKCFGVEPMSKRKLLIDIRRHLRSVMKHGEKATVFAFQDSALKHILVSAVGLRNLKVVACERNNPFIKGKSTVARIKASLPYILASYCVFQTSMAKDYYILPDSKCRIIPNPVVQSRHKWRGNLSDRRLVSVCRLHEQKNIPLSLQAVKILKDPFPDIILDIYGEGELKEKIEEMIRDMGLSRHVRLKGLISDVTGILPGYSVFLSTSSFEGISNSMLEAMSVGMPVVCTDCPIGGARVMLDGNAGILVPVDNPQSIADAVARLLTDKEFAMSVAANALARTGQFSPENITSDWLSITHGMK